MRVTVALRIRRFSVVDVGLFALEISAHGIVVEFDGSLDHGGAVLGSLVGKVGRNFLLGELGALVVAFPDQRRHLQRGR